MPELWNHRLLSVASRLVPQSHIKFVALSVLRQCSIAARFASAGGPDMNVCSLLAIEWHERNP